MAEWVDIITKLGLSGTSAALMYAVITLWKKLEVKDVEIKALNAEMRQTLIAISQRSDDD